jgi:3-phenylpropionate/cinnamic acid dioxygenase small subunit
MELSDRIQIENQIFRYTRYVDTCQWDDLGRLFTHARITANKTAQVLIGGDVIRDYWKGINRQYENGTLNTHHVVTNLEWVETPDGHIQVKSCFTVFQATPVLPLQPIACGRYDDVFEKADDGWRFRSKHIDVTLVGNMSQHLNIALA